MSALIALHQLVHAPRPALVEGNQLGQTSRLKLVENCVKLLFCLTAWPAEQLGRIVMLLAEIN